MSSSSSTSKFTIDYFFDAFFPLRLASQGSWACVVMIVMENIAVVYFLDLGNFGIRDVVGFDDTQVVVDKLVRVSFAFQTQDTAARKNLSFLTMV
ncbi:hypothetical protein Tco_0932376 [Tanacetum coccineum]